MRHAADVLRDQLAVGVDQRGAEVAHLVDHHVVGGALQVGRHLVGDRGQRVADHFQRDRIERLAFRGALDLRLALERRLLAGLRHHAPPTLMINSPDGATVHTSFWNSTVVVPCSCTSAGPTILRPGGELLALIDRAAHRLLGVAEIDVAAMRDRAAAALAEARKLQRRPLADHREPHVDHLDRIFRRRVRVAVLVELVEGGADRLAVALADVLDRDRHRQREILPDIAQIELDPLFGILGVTQASLGAVAHLLIDLRQLGEIEGREVRIIGADEVVALVGGEHAERREVRRELRHDHGRDVQLARDRDDMQRAGAAGGDQREVARIETLLHRHLAHRQRHLRDRDLDDRLRGGDGVDLQRLGDLLGDAARGGIGVELHLTAEEVVGIEPTKHDIGVGDGRLGAAPAVADRARIGARALRADLERADVVDPGDRAAAGADLDHVDHRQHHRMARRIAADVVAGRERRLAVLDQARLGGGAAHVERDHVVVAERLADLRRGDDAADRA